MFNRMLTNRAGRIVLFALVMLAPCVQNSAFRPSALMELTLGAQFQKSFHCKFGTLLPALP
jgi:hypothetical protein